MNSATQALLGLVSVLAILGLPGAALVAVLRLRGFTAVALTPVLSVSVIAVSAVVGPLLGMAWGWWVPAVGTVLVVVALLLLTGLWRRLQLPGRSDGQDGGAAGVRAGWEPGVLPWGLAGAAVAAGLISVRLLLAAPGLEPITQNYDTVFHLNAVHYALEAGNVSSWFVGMFNRPGSTVPHPYPGAWHGLVTLLVQLSGLSIAAATNVTWLAVAGLVWPASALLLTRTLVGPQPVVLAAAGVLTSAFTAFPYLLLQYGTVYPNALSYAILPVGLALVLTLLGQARSPVVSRARAGLLLVLYLPAQGLSQPNGLFSIAFLLTPLLVVLVLSWLRAGFGRSHATGWGRTGLVLVSLTGAAALLSASDTIRRLFNWAHPKSMSFDEALWRAATHFPLPAASPALVLSALVLWGLYQLARHDGRRWMIASFVLTVLVYGLAIGSDNELGNALIAPWYGNPDRLAALMPLFGVPWAAVGLERVIAAVRRRLRGPRTRPALFAPLVALAAAALLATTSPTLWQTNTALAETFRVPAASDDGRRLDADELRLLEQLGEHVPEDAVLANNPWNGSPLAVALAGHDVLYPYMTMESLDEDRALLRGQLDEIATSEPVCSAAERLDVEYLLDFGESPVGQGPLYAGIDRAADSQAFEEVAAVGEARLLKLARCAGRTA
ncbi:DUF6541 family protein [Kocuria kalidii]|uniref:DUF6541 family protein n=1 Tax=Kocuria kalidii TaxID=3376283 RepID=UPI0037AFA001